eukprot:COSAG04_NODE_106_length_25980_cov_446.060160_8_plen_352_part_00
MLAAQHLVHWADGSVVAVGAVLGADFLRAAHPLRLERFSPVSDCRISAVQFVSGGGVFGWTAIVSMGGKKKKSKEERAEMPVSAARQRQKVGVPDGAGGTIPLSEKLERGVASSGTIGTARYLRSLITAGAAGLEQMLDGDASTPLTLLQQAATVALKERQPAPGTDSAAAAAREWIIDKVLLDLDQPEEHRELFEKAPPMLLLELFFNVCTNWWVGPLAVLILEAEGVKQLNDEAMLEAKRLHSALLDLAENRVWGFSGEMQLTCEAMTEPARKSGKRRRVHPGLHKALRQLRKARPDLISEPALQKMLKLTPAKYEQILFSIGGMRVGELVRCMLPCLDDFAALLASLT